MSSPASSSLPPGLDAEVFELADTRAGRVTAYVRGDASSAHAPLLLVHSVNAAAAATEVRPIFDHYGATRPTYAIDLPGFGLSDRSDRDYTPRLMTDAIRAATAEIQRAHGGDRIDALALSLSSEFLARAAVEEPAAYRSIALVSPTGFSGTRKRTGPRGSTRAIPGMLGIVSFSLWDDALFDNLTRPSVVRYFLARTWGSPNIDEKLWAYAVRSAREPGAKHAPFHFLSGHLFSNDVNTLYDALQLPVWMCHGVRGDFVDYRGVDALRERNNWRITTFETGALPHFEVPEAFFGIYDGFLRRAGSASAPA